MGAADGLKGRVYDVNQGDLNGDSSDTFRKFKLICEDVQGKNCMLNFHGMSLTRDKICSMVKKWHTMINVHVDVKTTDNYHLRIFVVAFTKKQKNQQKKTTYAQSQQVKLIRQKMVETINQEVQSGDIRALVTKLLPDSIAMSARSRLSRSLNSIFLDLWSSMVKLASKPTLKAKLLPEVTTTNHL